MRRLLRDNTNDEHPILICHGENPYVQNMTEGDWEQLGREVASNTHLEEFAAKMSALNSEKMTSLFRGLTGSSSINSIDLKGNEPGIYDVRSMIPFVQNARCLRHISIARHNITSDSFAALFRALSNSPVEELNFRFCGLTFLDIDRNYMPDHLRNLDLSNNNIGPDGCRGLATLLQEENSELGTLDLDNNNLNDEAVQVLVNALRNNTSLHCMALGGNDEITREGMILLLKLVNDVSSIKATLQSNHTLIEIDFRGNDDDYSEIEDEIRCALGTNNLVGLETDAAKGKFKVIWTQLESSIRQRMCLAQGIESQFHSIAVPINEIGPLLLPEVLSIIYEHHGRFNLYEALTSTVADLWSTISRKQVLIDKAKVLSDQIGRLTTQKMQVLEEIAAIEQKEAEESNVFKVGAHMNKRQKMS